MMINLVVDNDCMRRIFSRNLMFVAILIESDHGPADPGGCGQFVPVTQTVARPRADSDLFIAITSLSGIQTPLNSYTLYPILYFRPLE